MIEWSRGWDPLYDEKHRSYLERELAWELAENPHHILASHNYEAIGRFGVYDDLILRLDGRNEFAWVHLAWNRENRPQGPHCELLGEVRNPNQFLRNWKPLLEQVDSEDESAEA